MKRYKDWSPSALDCRGLGLNGDDPDDNRQEWFVAPVIQTRDSGALERSNFRVLRADLEREGIAHEKHRFGHWGPGWFEIILVEPTPCGEKWCEEWEGALSSYPIACEHDHSELEDEENTKAWSSFYWRDITRVFRSMFGLSDGAVDLLQYYGEDVAREYLLSGYDAERPDQKRVGRYGEGWLCFEGEDLSYREDRELKTFERDNMARLLCLARWARSQERKEQ